MFEFSRSKISHLVVYTLYSKYMGGLATEKGYRTFGDGHQLYKYNTNFSLCTVVGNSVKGDPTLS